MPDKTSSDSTQPDASGGGSKRLIIMGVLCAVICAGGFVLGGRMAGGATPEAVAAEPEEEEPKIEKIVELDPLNINLAEGHYLRVAVAIGLSHVEEAADDYGHGASDEDQPPIETAPASDLVLGTFAGRNMSDLQSAGGRERARADLLEGLAAYYGDKVVTVLFTEFVMQ